MNQVIRQTSSDYFLDRLKSSVSYKKYLREELTDRPSRKKFLARSSSFGGYPENHNYSYYNNRLIPAFKLYERFERISSLYPANPKSLLDLSACRGFYVLEASLRESIEVAVGIDIDEEFIRECNAIKMFVGAQKASFFVSTLQALHEELAREETSFETVIFTGSYHYFYWGSGQSSLGYFDHDKILRMLADIASDRVIFSGRMELSQLATYPREISANHPNRTLYNTEEFLRCAGKYFRVSHHGFLGRSALFLLEKH